MKYLLTSEGFTTGDIVSACEDLVGKSRNEISVAIINEAYVLDPGDKRWIIRQCNQIAENFGGEINFVNLLALDKEQIKERLAAHDIIHMMGGDTDYLMSLLNKVEFEEILQGLEDKVYAGTSAGSMVVSTRMTDEAYAAIYGMTNQFGITEYMNRLDFTFFPHLNSPNFSARTTELLKQCENFFAADAYCLEDTQAIAIDGDNRTFIGGNPLLIRDGKVVEN